MRLKTESRFESSQQNLTIEHYRMKNYDLERLAVTNHKMHVFLGRAKVSKGRESSDYRLFTR